MSLSRLFLEEKRFSGFLVNFRLLATWVSCHLRRARRILNGQRGGERCYDEHVDVVGHLPQRKGKNSPQCHIERWVGLKAGWNNKNRMAIGAQLKLTTEDGNSQYDIVSTSAGYGASRDPRAHFGLGQFKTVKQLDIRWPSGMHQVLKSLAADRIHRVEEP